MPPAGGIYDFRNQESFLRVSSASITCRAARHPSLPPEAAAHAQRCDPHSLLLATAADIDPCRCCPRRPHGAATLCARHSRIKPEFSLPIKRMDAMMPLEIQILLHDQCSGITTILSKFILMDHLKVITLQIHSYMFLPPIIAPILQRSFAASSPSLSSFLRFESNRNSICYDNLINYNCSKSAMTIA